MRVAELQHKETCLTESLYSALDARETVIGTGSTMLLYLADMFIAHIREELLDVRGALEDTRRSEAQS